MDVVHTVGAASAARSVVPSRAAGLWTAYRYAVAGVLVVAAVLKAWGPSTEVVELPFAGALPWLLPVAEVVLAWWLVLGCWPGLLRGVVVGVFCLFGGYALHTAMAGREACGCFGAVAVSPWVTAGLDLGVVLAGCLLTPARPVRSRRRVAMAVLGGVMVAAVVMAGMLLATTPAPGVMIAYGSATLTPADWTGHDLPIAEHLRGDHAGAVAHGEHLLILHRAECPACRELLRQVPAAGTLPVTQVAADATTCASADAADLCLDPDLRWLVGTPAVVHVVDGRVAAVGQGVGPGLRVIAQARRTAAASAGPDIGGATR